VKPFTVHVADLVHRPAKRRSERLSGPTAAMVMTETSVANGATLEIDALLEAVSDGVLASGSAGIAWSAVCRRCLAPVNGRTDAAFREMYSLHPIEGETYPIVNDQVDLELVAREAILLDLPLAPVCREECAGLCLTCGADLNDGPCSCAPTAPDPRWSVLDGLRADLVGSEPDPGES
jgi:uncharacterized protein